MGWKLHPVNPMTKTPFTHHGFLDATDNMEQLEEWWSRWPNASIGLSLPDTISVVDLDDIDALPLLSKFPETVTSKTPRVGGGVHLFFSKDENISLPRKIRFLYGTDLLNKGGYVILPYSKHPSGGNYKWLKSPTKHVMAPLPQWVIDLALKEEESGLDEIGDGVLSGKLDPEQILRGVPDGMRNNALFRFACWMRAHKVPYKLAILGLEEAAAKCDPPYTEKSAESFVERAYRQFPEGYSPNYKKSERKFWTAKDLMRAEMGEPNWFVEKILPQGFCLFYAHPKTGKSIVAEGMARSIAAGEPVFNGLATEQCEVLYMELEMGEHMAKNRWSRIFGRKAVPDGLTIVFEWDRLDLGGYEQLVKYLQEHPATKVVFIDTLVKIWPTKDLVGGTAYNKDYAVGERFAQIASEFQVAIVCVYHKTKASHMDSMKNISSSMGLPAAADVLWDMNRGEMGAPSTIEIFGKCVEHGVIELMPKNGDIFDWSMG